LIALDLEGLGLAGDHAETICARINQQGLVKAELSVLQHAETMRLLTRRGMEGRRDELTGAIAPLYQSQRNL